MKIYLANIATIRDATACAPRLRLVWYRVCRIRYCCRFCGCLGWGDKFYHHFQIGKTPLCPSGTPRLSPPSGEQVCEHFFEKLGREFCERRDREVCKSFSFVAGFRVRGADAGREFLLRNEEKKRSKRRTYQRTSDWARETRQAVGERCKTILGRKIPWCRKSLSHLGARACVVCPRHVRWVFWWGEVSLFKICTIDAVWDCFAHKKNVVKYGTVINGTGSSVTPRAGCTADVSEGNVLLFFVVSLRLFYCRLRNACRVHTRFGDGMCYYFILCFHLLQEARKNVAPVPNRCINAHAQRTGMGLANYIASKVEVNWDT